MKFGTSSASTVRAGPVCLSRRQPRSRGTRHAADFRPDPARRWPPTANASLRSPSTASRCSSPMWSGPRGTASRVIGPAKFKAWRWQRQAVFCRRLRRLDSVRVHLTAGQAGSALPRSAARPSDRAGLFGPRHAGHRRSRRARALFRLPIASGPSAQRRRAVRLDADFRQHPHHRARRWRGADRRSASRACWRSCRISKRNSAKYRAMQTPPARARCPVPWNPAAGAARNASAASGIPASRRRAPSPSTTASSTSSNGDGKRPVSLRLPRRARHPRAESRNSASRGSSRHRTGCSGSTGHPDG